MASKSIEHLPREHVKEIMEILMENDLYLELPLDERSGLIEYIYNEYMSK